MMVVFIVNPMLNIIVSLVDLSMHVHAAQVGI